jgi:hypothetical protein
LSLAAWLLWGGNRAERDCGEPDDKFYPAPHSEYNGHEEYLHEPVTGMDGVELPWHILINDGAHKKRGMKPNPHPDSKKHRTLPVDDPKTHDPVINRREGHAGRDSLAKIVHLFFDMDRMVGRDFETGLANLKAIVEA